MSTPTPRQQIADAVALYAELLELAPQTLQSGDAEDRQMLREGATAIGYPLLVLGRQLAGQQAQAALFVYGLAASFLLVAAAESAEQLAQLPLAAIAEVRAQAATFGAS